MKYTDGRKFGYSQPDESSNFSSDERTLWQAVLLLMLDDALNETTVDPEAIASGIDARRMIRFNTADFREVAELAGFDPDHVRDAFLSKRFHHADLRIPAAETLRRGRYRDGRMA